MIYYIANAINIDKKYIAFAIRPKYYGAIDMHNEGKIKEYCEMMFEIVIEQFRL